MVSRARFGDNVLEPPVPTWVLDTDGIGPPLDAPPAGGSGRWLLLDGYVYDIHEDHPQGQQPGQWAVNEARPPDPDTDLLPR